MEYIISPIWIFIELSTIILFSSSFLHKKKNANKHIISFIIVWIASSIYSNVGLGALLVQLLNLCAVFLLLTGMFESKWLYRLLCAVVAWVFMSTIDTSVAYGFCSLLGISHSEFVWKKLLYIAVMSISKLIELFLAYLFSRLRRTKVTGFMNNKWTYLIILFPVVSIAMLITMFLNSQTNEDLPIAVFVFCCILAVANGAIIYLIGIMEKRSSDEHQLALMNQQMDIQTQNTISLEKSYRAQRQASHEFNHQMQTVTNLLSQKKYSEAEKYLLEIQGNYSMRTFAVNSHHPILDAIFNQKYQTACEQNVDMLFTLNDLSAIEIKANHLVVLFSNLLDNALEACAKCEGEKAIKCCIEKTTCLYVSIRNTSPPVSIVDNRIETTKATKSEHGYGLKNVCRILDELQAEYAFEYSDGWFQFVAEIPLVQEC